MKNNWFRVLVGFVTNNLVLKILAVMISCILWFVVNNITDPLEDKPFNNIPVEIINSDLITNEGKVYEVLDGTNFVNVRLRGKRSIIRDITRDDLRAVADMAELTFMNTVRIEVSSNRNNSDLEFKCSTENLKLSIENMISFERRIKVSTTGTPEEGYIIGDVSQSQNVVRLSGPESLMSQIDHVEAVANTNGYSSDINTSVDLKLYNKEDKEIRSGSIKMNISTITVGVTILPTKEVPLNFTVSGEPEQGYVVGTNMKINPMRVLLAGRKTTLDAINGLAITDTALNLEDKTEDFTAVINIRKYLPTGTRFADANFDGNISVTVGIEPLVTRDLEIPSRNFAAGNAPENFDVTLHEFEADEPRPFKIRISGTKAAVDAVNPDTVIGVVDMNAMLKELNLEEWAVGGYSGTITFNLPDNVELAEEYKLTVVVQEKEENQDNQENQENQHNQDNQENQENQDNQESEQANQ